MKLINLILSICLTFSAGTQVVLACAPAKCCKIEIEKTSCCNTKKPNSCKCSSKVTCDTTYIDSINHDNFVLVKTIENNLPLTESEIDVIIVPNYSSKQFNYQKLKQKPPSNNTNLPLLI